jgi:iron complex outermembrane recepter protein
MMNEVLRAAVAGIGALTATALVAQTRGDSSAVKVDNALEQVVVTARRKAEREQDVPLAVTALSGDFLERNAVTNITDLNGKVPSLSIESFNSRTYTNVGIRANRSANIAPGQDPAVGYYFNEVNFGFPVGINQQMFDLQAVEVVKGPQGTLFGRNTTGGAVLMTSARPTDEFEGSTSVGYTTFDGRDGHQGTAILNLPVADALAIRLGGEIVRRDGYVENLISDQQLAAYEVTPYLGTTNGKPMNDEHSSAWRVSVLWRPSDDVESLLIYQGSRMRTRGLAYTLTALNPLGFANFATGGAALSAFERRQQQQDEDFWTTEQGAALYDRLSTYGITNTTTWSITDSLTVKNVAGWRRFDLEQAIGISGLPFQILDSRINDYGREWSEELQLQGEAGTRISWVAGAYYSEQRIRHPNNSMILPQFGSVPDDQGSLSENDSRALFVQATVQIPGVQGLSFTGGARRTKDNREMAAFHFASELRSACVIRDANGSPLPANACQLRGKTDYARTTYNLSLDYKLDDQTLIYLARRRGYRAGGWNYLPDNPQTFGPFEPEDVTDYEVGLKKDWFFGDASLRTNLAVYTQDYNGIQRFSNPVSNPTAFAVINAADSTITGGELELTFMPVSSLELGAFFSYIDADFKQFVTGSGDFSDNEFAQVPKRQYAVRARYTLPLGTAIGDVSLQADYNYRSHVFFVDTAEGPGDGPRASQGQDGYGLLNLRVDWETVLSSDFDLSLYVKNATAEEYNTFGIQLYSSLGYNIATIGEPRVVGLQGTYRF